MSILLFAILFLQQLPIQAAGVESRTDVLKQSSVSRGNRAGSDMALALVLRTGVPPGYIRVQIQIYREQDAPLLRGGDVHVRILDDSGRVIPFGAMQKDSDVLGGIANAGRVVVMANFQVQGDGEDVGTVEMEYAGSTYALSMARSER